MAYFSPDFIQFFEELAGDNSKDWFDENRKRYHEVIKDPWYAFVQAVIDEVKKDDTKLTIEPKQAVFRINRDIRFSKNKEPYKTYVAAVISRGGRKELTYPWLYVHLWQDGVHIGSGCHMPDKMQLQQIRTALVSYPKKVEKILHDPIFVELFGELKGEKNKRLPKEFQEYQEEYPLVANKQFFFLCQTSTQGDLERWFTRVCYAVLVYG